MSSSIPTITVEAKVVGQRRPVFTDWRVPLPPDADGRRPLTLRDLITVVVSNEVEAFKQRQEERRLARVLTKEQIEEGAAKGKIESGEREFTQEVNTDAAVGTALQAFEDGLYFVFLDDVQQERLDQEVAVKNDSHLMFVRLVALAGG